MFIIWPPGRKHNFIWTGACELDPLELKESADMTNFYILALSWFKTRTKKNAKNVMIFIFFSMGWVGGGGCWRRRGLFPLSYHFHCSWKVPCRPSGEYSQLSLLPKNTQLYHCNPMHQIKRSLQIHPTKMIEFFCHGKHLKVDPGCNSYHIQILDFKVTWHIK